MSTNPEHWLEILERDDAETVTVPKASLRHLAEHARAVEANRDELLRLLGEAHIIMDGPGTTDERMRKAGRLLGLLNKHREKKDWQAIADRYWQLRFGIPPDEVGGPVEPIGHDDAAMEIEQEYCSHGEYFESIQKAWTRHKIKVSTRRRHPTYKDSIT